MEALTSPHGIMIWLGALCTLTLYSILYRENPLYRAAEHAFLGLATGYGLYAVWAQVLYGKWYQPITKGQWLWALALVPGLMYYTIYSRRFNWMSRVVMMTMMGFEAGLIFRSWAGAYMPQIGNSFRPVLQPLSTLSMDRLVHPDPSAVQAAFVLSLAAGILLGSGAWSALSAGRGPAGLPPAAGGALAAVGACLAVYFLSLLAFLFLNPSNLIFIVTLVSVMVYFLFSFEHRSKGVRKTADLGRWLMMIAFGAMFGSTVMARMSLFIGRLWYLFAEWIHLIPRG